MWARILGAILVTAMVSMTMTGCGGDGAKTAIARSELKRTTDPGVTSAEAKTLQAGNAAFATDLYRALAAEEGNVFFSPHSISVALAMTYAGARGVTAEEMGKVLRFATLGDRVHAGFNGLDLELAKRPDVRLMEGEKGTPPELSIANSTWGDKGQEFLPAFLDVLALHYGAGMRLVDFNSEPEAAREAINGWVEEKTKDRIKDLVPPGVITNLTELVLANAIYFKGSWATPFDPAKTAKGPFRLLGGGTVQADLMHANVTARYAEASGLQAVELRYVGGEIAMVVLLPADGRFDEFERAVDAAAIESLLAKLQESAVNLTLPRFTFESTFRLDKTLATLGMPSAFEPGKADFSGIDGTRDLFISAVLHKAFVAVDEKGTEAAAATAVVIGRTSLPQPATMTVDRPFVFLIRDIPTGAILFMGRVVDPTK